MQINTIITGDCREVLPTIPSNSFALAFADPPYWVGFNYGDKTDDEMDYIEPEWLVSELLRIADCVLVTPGYKFEEHYPKPVWKIAWNKPASTGQNGIGGFNVWEPVFVYGSPKKPIWQDACTFPGGRENDASFHKCPKPISLLKWLLDNFTDPGDSVIDPVCGSGTTCKAAFQLSRNYLGIELDKKIAQQARKRLSSSQPPLLSVGHITPREADLLRSGERGAENQLSMFAGDGSE